MSKLSNVKFLDWDIDEIELDTHQFQNLNSDQKRVLISNMLLSHGTTYFAEPKLNHPSNSPTH